MFFVENKNRCRTGNFVAPIIAENGEIKKYFSAKKSLKVE